MSKLTDLQNPSAKTDTTVTQHKSTVEESYKPGDKDLHLANGERDMVLSHQEAQAGSPADVAACGEEDPGSGLESLVTREESDHNYHDEQAEKKPR